ncbi:MAG: hypothetical protein KGI06_03835 [Candidatus Micrarchaeota archaeon]|nr:hypothetical protein [Candidatus Micrarchaeota archaeon]
MAELCEFCGFAVVDNDARIGRYHKKEKKTDVYHRECYKIMMFEKISKYLKSMNDELGYIRNALEEKAAEDED